MRNMREMFVFDMHSLSYCVRWDVSNREMQFHYDRDKITNREELEAGRRAAIEALGNKLAEHWIEESSLIPLPMEDRYRHRPLWAGSAP